jgi:hypothetical protein
MQDRDKPDSTEEGRIPNDSPAAVQWMMQQAAAGQSAVALPASTGELAVPALAPASTDLTLAARQQRIADALRGNERLTEGLPADAAESLLAWGLELAREIVRDTAGLDDAAAEDVLQPRVRAVRRLMMAAGRATNPAEETPEVEEWLKQAAVALGDRFRPPARSKDQDLRQQWQAQSGQPGRQIALLRHFIDQLTASLP